jgi:hypothetical protein
VDAAYQRVPGSTSAYHIVSQALQLGSPFVLLTWRFAASRIQRSNPATSTRDAGWFLQVTALRTRLSSAIRDPSPTTAFAFFKIPKSCCQ